ncbi:MULTISPECIES: hypothetical protein [Streptomyces]|nr:MULTISPECIES: hypothetical protein [Streptomyces]
MRNPKKFRAPAARTAQPHRAFPQPAKPRSVPRPRPLPKPGNRS